MTEAEWLGCESVTDMLKVFPDRTSARKLRLFAVACCRRLPGLDESSLQSLDIAERHAEGLVDSDALRLEYMKAFGRAVASENNRQDECGYNTAQALAWVVVFAGVGPREIAASLPSYFRAGRAVPGLDERRAQAVLLADVVLVPSSASVSPAWLAWNGGTVG